MNHAITYDKRWDYNAATVSKREVQIKEDPDAQEAMGSALQQGRSETIPPTAVSPGTVRETAGVHDETGAGGCTPIHTS